MKGARLAFGRFEVMQCRLQQRKLHDLECADLDFKIADFQRSPQAHQGFVDIGLDPELILQRLLQYRLGKAFGIWQRRHGFVEQGLANQAVVETVFQCLLLLAGGSRVPARRERAAGFYGCPPLRRGIDQPIRRQLFKKLAVNAGLARNQRLTGHRGGMGRHCVAPEKWNDRTSFQ
ncbi:hypothetical protein D3C85_656570 [compost metagenome]